MIQPSLALSTYLIIIELTFNFLARTYLFVKLNDFKVEKTEPKQPRRKKAKLKQAPRVMEPEKAEEEELIEVEPKLETDMPPMDLFRQNLEEEEENEFGQSPSHELDHPLGLHSEDHHMALHSDDQHDLGGLHPDDHRLGQQADDELGQDEEPRILSCAYCPKVFASNWHLKRHVLTHTKVPEDQL